MSRFRSFLARYGTMLAFLALALAGGYTINAQAEANATTLYETQLAGCERANKVRTESNERINAHVTERNVLASFLESAAEARESAGSKIDVKAAQEYRALKDSLKRVQFREQDLIDCAKTIEKP